MTRTKSTNTVALAMAVSVAVVMAHNSFGYHWWQAAVAGAFTAVMFLTIGLALRILR